MRFADWICLALALPWLGGSAIATAQEKPRLNYGRDVRPILSENCFLCHGQDTKKRMAGLRLDSFEDATADRGGHAALVPGKPEASLIYQRITAEPAGPPHAARLFQPHPDRRPDRDSQALDRGRRPIHQALGLYAAGTPACPRCRRPRGSSSRSTGSSSSASQRKACSPAPKPRPAPGSAAFRSISSACLPRPPNSMPSRSEVKARGEAAYDAAVDRLLASPRYGERMAMDWLDVARYADTHGFNNDAARSMWRWRDWVIQSFNDNMPYDRFITEQLAGDLLPNPTLDQRIATGFGRNHVINSEGGIIDEEYRVEYVTDRVRTARHGVAGTDARMRALSRPQIRSHHAARSLPLLRLLQ